jgi:hypothetical protein
MNGDAPQAIKRRSPMNDVEQKGQLVLRKTGSRLAYFLDGRMVRKGDYLELADGVGGWIRGRFHWEPLKGESPTLLCPMLNPHDADSTLLNILTLGGDALLRRPA